MATEYSLPNYSTIFVELIHGFLKDICMNWNASSLIQSMMPVNISISFDDNRYIKKPS